MTSSTRTRTHRTLRLTAIGVAATGICVAGAGLAAAANPGSSFGQAVGSAAEAVGIDWSAMPDGYTREQYEAFWGAGYSPEDAGALAEIWETDGTETKARAGQMILDGEQLPFAPGTHTLPTVPLELSAEIDAFFAAGYTDEDLEALSALWSTEFVETKTTAVQMLADGQPLPVEPSGTPTTTTDD